MPNPALTEWRGPYGLPEFDQIADADYAPCFEHAFSLHVAEIEAICRCGEAPTFENTIVALEKSGEALSRVSALFWNRAGTDTSEVIQALEPEIAGRLSRHASAIAMNATLFARVDELYARRDNLGQDGEGLQVLERRWKDFVRAGAKLSADGQGRLAEINERLASLGARFGQNVLNDEKSWAMELTEESELAGLPDFVLEAMASASEERGLAARHAVTLSRSIIEPFLTFSTRRDLRERAFGAWMARGESAGRDNWPLIAEILALRAEKARLLGYDSFAAFKLEDTMAKTPAAVEKLLGEVWEKAVARAGEEQAELERVAAAEGHNHAILPWDWRHYSEKVRAARFDFTEEDLKPYLQLDNVIAACFEVARRLFGIRVEERESIAAYHPDVRVFEVTGADGRHIGMFLGDYFNRPSKRSGAWMSALRRQDRLPRANCPEGARPIVCNVMNFARPAAGKPALLSLDDASTLFHEFGHALHGLLSDVSFPSVSGTSVSRDFVELPSQLYEHWLTVPEILARHAVHYRTGAPMPQALLDKVLAARTFNAGFDAVEYGASALVDMAYHVESGPIDDPAAFEAGLLKRLGMPGSIVMRHRSPHFLHVFSGDGYSAGYYSYLWSEVLDADAYAAFEERGDPFDAEIASRLRSSILSVGGSADPEEAYRAFRGRLPTPDAMMRQRGLVA